MATSLDGAAVVGEGGVVVVTVVGAVVVGVVVVDVLAGTDDGPASGVALDGGPLLGAAVAASVDPDPDPAATTPTPISPTATATRPTPSTRNGGRGPPGAGSVT